MIRHLPLRLRFAIEPEGGDPKPGAPSTDPTTGEPAKTEQPLGEAGLKALQSERDARAAAEKALAEAQAKVKTFEDAQKTDAEKAADALATARRDAADAALRALRYEVAADKGLDLKLAPRLAGATKAELEADADALKELVKAAPATGAGPKPDPSQGGGSGNDRGASVAAGRDLFAARHPSKTTT